MQIHVVRKKEKNGCDMQKMKNTRVKHCITERMQVCDVRVVVAAVVA